TGNVALKTAEGATQAVVSFLKQTVVSSLRARLGAVLLRPALKALRRKIDYAEAGGAPLLGVDGVVIVTHGRSNALALKNAILAADRLAKLELTKKAAAAISAHAAAWSSAESITQSG
ncbi:MAG: phosphate acyltransferase, partial [Pseudomonadota bacterium]